MGSLFCCTRKGKWHRGVSSVSPDFSHLLVTKRRKRRPDSTSFDRWAYARRERHQPWRLGATREQIGNLRLRSNTADKRVPPRPEGLGGFGPPSALLVGCLFPDRRPPRALNTSQISSSEHMPTYRARHSAREGRPPQAYCRYAEEADQAQHSQDGSWRRCSRGGVRNAG